MRESQRRDLYIDTLGSQLSHPLSVQRYHDPRHDVWSLLTACQEHADGVRQLAAVVRTFHVGSRAMRELDELIECMFPDEYLGRRERDELLALLADAQPGWLSRACRHAHRTSWLSASLDWTDPVAVVARLESCIGTPGAPPPLLTFVDFVAHQADTASSAKQHRWIDKIGMQMNLDPGSLRELCVATVARLEESQRFYFIVQLKPDGVDPDRYLMSVWLQHHQAVEEPLYRDDDPMTLAEMIERLPELLVRAHEDVGVEASEMIVEFMLPRGMIGDPVDQWEIDQVFPHRLGTSYPVVVRSLDRLGKQELHTSWRHKWRWISTNGHRDDPGAVYWLLEPHRSPASMHASLLHDDAAVAVAMAFPPKPEQKLMSDELTAALYAGVPVVLWCRDAGLRDEFEREAKEILTGRGLAELPNQVWRMRQRAHAEDNATIVGRHLTLLWDDADRIPEAFRPVRLQAPR